MKKNDWKDRLNIVYSTNPDFKYEETGEEETPTLEKTGNLCVSTSSGKEEEEKP